MWTRFIFLIFIVYSKGGKNDKEKLIPKKIWMMWDQGLDSAHLSVKLCHQSWVSKNPDHTVKLLSLKEAEDLLGKTTHSGPENLKKSSKKTCEIK